MADFYEFLMMFQGMHQHWVSLDIKGWVERVQEWDGW